MVRGCVKSEELAFLCLPGLKETPIFRYVELYRRILQCNGISTHTVMVLFPIWCLMKTVILHCNGSWKYIVIGRVESSEIWVHRLGPGKHKNAAIWFLYFKYMGIVNKPMTTGIEYRVASLVWRCQLSLGPTYLVDLYLVLEVADPYPLALHLLPRTLSGTFYNHLNTVLFDHARVGSIFE